MKMTVSEYRIENTAKLIKLGERQISITVTLSRIEKHLEQLNGKTGKNSDDIIRFKAWGALAIFIIPITVSIIMRLII